MILANALAAKLSGKYKSDLLQTKEELNQLKNLRDNHNLYDC